MLRSGQPRAARIDVTLMNPLADLIREQIQHNGPLAFRRFMEMALYQPEHGYYTRRRDPFGRAGDFYTAEQLQPVFGILIAAIFRRLRQERGAGTFAVVELGAGRGELEPYLAEFGYAAVDVNRGALAESIHGAILANEFFDALPVDLCVYRDECWRMRDVDVDGERFRFRDGAPARKTLTDYLERYGPQQPAEGTLAEVNLAAIEWIGKIGARLHGTLLIIDYGYTRRELLRFTEGTLMSYRKHQASADVLADPGERDITAHVNFTALEQHALSCGFRRLRFESMTATLLAAGEADQFAEALAGDQTERSRRTLQLKNLLFGLGESFRTLLLAKD